MESDSIMLEAPALSAQRVVGLIVPSVGAHAATEPGECSSPAPPPRGVLPTMSSDLGLRGRGFWRCSRAADSCCWSASAICATGDRVVPKAADPTWDRDPIRIPIRIVSSKRPPPPSRPDKTSLRRAYGQDLKAPAVTEWMLQRLPRRRRRPRFAHVVGVHGSADHGVATTAAPLATGSTTSPHDAGPHSPALHHLGESRASSWRGLCIPA